MNRKKEKLIKEEMSMNIFRRTSKKVYMIINKIIVLMAIGVLFSSCSSKDNTTGSSGGNHVWLMSKQTNYAVSNGVVTVTSESEIEWIIYRHRSDTDFEHKYTMETSTGYSTHHIVRSGQNETFSQISGDWTFHRTIVFHSTSGLVQSQTTNYNGTITSVNYTIELQSDSGGIRTYSHFVANTGSAGNHSIHQIQNGRTIERRDFRTNALHSIVRTTYTATSTVTRTYNASNVLLQILTSFAPDNAIIRRKLPDFRLTNIETPATPTINSTRTVEILSDSASELVIRVKVFNSSNALIAQWDGAYARHNR